MIVSSIFVPFFDSNVALHLHDNNHISSVSYNYLLEHLKFLYNDLHFFFVKNFELRLIVLNF